MSRLIDADEQIKYIKIYIHVKSAILTMRIKKRLLHVRKAIRHWKEQHLLVNISQREWLVMDIR